MTSSVGRRLVVASLMMVAVGSARGARAGEGAQAPPGGKDGRLFGSAGTLVVTAGTGGWQRTAFRPDASSSTSVRGGGSLSLSVDAFLVDRWSLGVAGEAGWSHGAGAASPAGWSTDYTLEARLGRAIPLGTYATLWPTLGVGASRRDGLASGGARTLLVASVDAPLLVHPNRRLFVGGGPRVRAVLNGNTQTLELSGQTFVGGVIGR